MMRSPCLWKHLNEQEELLLKEISCGWYYCKTKRSPDRCLQEWSLGSLSEFWGKGESKGNVMVEWVGKEDKNEKGKNDIIITTYDPILTTHPIHPTQPYLCLQQLLRLIRAFRVWWYHLSVRVYGVISENEDSIPRDDIRGMYSYSVPDFLVMLHLSQRSQ